MENEQKKLHLIFHINKFRILVKVEVLLHYHMLNAFYFYILIIYK